MFFKLILDIFLLNHQPVRHEPFLPILVTSSVKKMKVYLLKKLNIFKIKIVYALFVFAFLKVQ